MHPISIAKITKSWRIFFQNEKAAMFGLAFAFESYIPLECPRALSQHSHRECCWYPASHGVGTEPAGVSQRDWCGGCGVNANDRWEEQGSSQGMGKWGEPWGSRGPW